jgi:hypothetical protein
MRPWIPIFVVAVLVRVLILASPLVPRAYAVGGVHIEVEAVARALVDGRGFVDPYAIPTGPTAHPLPIQAGLQALLYLALGVTDAAAYARCVLGIVSCATAFALLPWFAGEVGLGRRAGVFGGLAAALIPLQGLGDALGWASNEAQAAVALSVLVALYVRRWKARELPAGPWSLALGAFTGFALHLAPALLPVAVGCWLFELWWTRDRWKWPSLALVVVGATLACGPWLWRNYTALGEPIFIRSNLGLELRLANHDGARADIWSTADARRRHPGNNAEEARRVRDEGEAAYMRRLRGETVAWIASHPWKFAALSGARVWHVWFGPPARPFEALPIAALTLLALVGMCRAAPRMSTPERAAVLIPLTCYPLVYYLVGYVPRYTFPLSVLLFMLAGVAISTHVPSFGQTASGTGRSISTGAGSLPPHTPPQ